MLSFLLATHQNPANSTETIGPVSKIRLATVIITVIITSNIHGK